MAGGGTRDTADGQELKTEKDMKLIIILLGMYFLRIKRIDHITPQVSSSLPRSEVIWEDLGSSHS